MFKNWFLLASVSCGVGFGSTFLISRNLQQSTLAGLGTVPAVAASLTILSRQRREEIERQVAKSKQQLQLTNASCSEISAQGQRLQEEIERQVAKSRLGLDDAQRQEQLLKDRCREISLHGKTLQAELEKAINSLVLRKQTQESSLIQLDAKVLDRQNNLQTTQAELTRIQNQRQSEITSSTTRLNDSARQSNLELQRIREEIRQYSAINRQLEAQITDLQNRSQSFQTILVDKEVDLRGIEYQISQMEERRNQVSISITDLDRLLDQKQSLLQGIDLKQQQSLQQEISDLLLQKQDQRILLDRLVINISTKQNNLLELDTEISERQANLDRAAIDLVDIEARKQSAIDSAQTSELALTNIEEEIRQDSAIKEQLKVEITDLQNQEESLQVEIATQRDYQTEAQQQISVLEEQQDGLELEICNRQQVKEDINSQIAKLEESIFLFSGHSIDEVPNIRISDLHIKWQELSEQISQLEEERNRLSIAVDDLIQSTDRSETPEKWENHLIFENNPHLRVLKHIDVHGTITELEVGTAREQRQFNIRFGEYLEHVPFSISNREGRYLKIAKESIIITDIQNPDARAQIEQEIDQLNQQKEQLSIAVDELYRSLEQDLEQQAVLRQEIADLLQKKQELRAEIDRLNQNLTSDDNSSEIIPPRYPTCMFCGNPPIPGHGHCNNCN